MGSVLLWISLCDKTHKYIKIYVFYHIKKSITKLTPCQINYYKIIIVGQYNNEHVRKHVTI